MSGARGIVTAFARILVSEPCWPLDTIAMPALAADNPSPDFPAIHPIFTYSFRHKGPLKIKANSMLIRVYPFNPLVATFDQYGRRNDIDWSLRRESKR